MTTPEIISIVAIIIAVITFVGTNIWKYKNHKNDLKKDTLLNISGALNRQTQLIVKAADINNDQSEINKVLSDNEFIFGQMYTAANAVTSQKVLECLANIAETLFEITLRKQDPDCDAVQLFKFAINKHSEHMQQLPSVIACMKIELGISGGVVELEDAIKSGCERINNMIVSLLNEK